MSEDPAVLQQQEAAAQLAATVAYQNALIHGQDETRALQAAIAAAQNSLQALGMVTNLQGPRNAFQQQAMEVGLNQQGFSRAFDALAGRYSIPSFGQSFAPPQAQSINTINGDMWANQGNADATDPVTQVMNNLFGQLGWNTQPTGPKPVPAPPPTQPAIPKYPAATAPPGGLTNQSMTLGGGPAQANVPMVGAPPPPADLTNGGTYMPTDYQRQQQLAALPNPNQINVRQWGQMSPDTQQFILGAYSTKGYSPNDVQNAIQRSAPQFTAPRFGSFQGG